MIAWTEATCFPSSGILSPLIFFPRNTLISALPFFESLFARLLSLNTRASTSEISPSPITLIIPYTVLLELDGLKTSNRAGIDARKANHWLLAALKTQKKVFVKVDPGDGNGIREMKLDEGRWALHVQNRSNMQEVMRNVGDAGAVS